jgi:hypothetical protein
MLASPLISELNKAFLEFYARNTDSRIEEMPTTGTIEEFRRDFETALAREQNFQAPGNISVTIKEVSIRMFNH